MHWKSLLMGIIQKIRRHAAIASGNFAKICKDVDIPPLPTTVTHLLDAGVDVHVGAEGGLERLLVHASGGHQLAVRHDALGQVPVEVLGDLLDRGHDILGRMDRHLSANQWLASGGPTIADVSLYAYTHSAGERGGFEMSRFPAIGDWLERIAGLPGYVGRDDIPE